MPASKLALEEADFAEVGRGRNLAFASALPLGADLDGPATVDDRILAFKAGVIDAARSRAALPAPTANGYAGSGPCLDCHPQEFSRWSLTGHAGAWEPLVDRKVTLDPECLGCHTTGFGQPGGFGEPSSANLGRFKSVQCESCHGPMAAHAVDTSVGGRPVTEQTCLPCHDPANSPQFDFLSYVRRGSCQEADRF